MTQRNPQFWMNGEAYSWANTKIEVRGRVDSAQPDGVTVLPADVATMLEHVFAFLTSVDYSEGQGIEPVYALGAVAPMVGAGSYACQGTLTFKKEAETALRTLAAGYGNRLLAIPSFMIQIQFGADAQTNESGGTDAAHAFQLNLPNCKLGTISGGQAAGATSFDVTVPFVCYGERATMTALS